MIDYPPVLTKTDFVRRYALMEFGNRSPTWENLDDYLSNDMGFNSPNDLLHLRNRIAGAETWYNVSPNKIGEVWNTALDKGYKAEMLYISAMAPTEKTTLQGEVFQTPTGISLFYSTVPKPMRSALQERSYQTYGTLALILLRQFMLPVCYDWLETLLDRYPYHVVEFSCYDCCWGTLPNWNTLFWEVRNY